MRPYLTAAALVVMAGSAVAGTLEAPPLRPIAPVNTILPPRTFTDPQGYKIVVRGIGVYTREGCGRSYISAPRLSQAENDAKAVSVLGEACAGVQ
jgi:hypothetical protein